MDFNWLYLFYWLFDRAKIVFKELRSATCFLQEIASLI